MIIREPLFEDLKELKALWKEAFCDTEKFINLFFDNAFSYARSRAVFIDGKPASTLYWFDCTCCGKRFAYIYAVATAKSHRGEGLCTSLMTDTHKHLLTLGYSGAILVPGEKSLFDFYERVGYAHRTSISLICASAFGETDLREIDALEYAKKRREFLPEGAVIQEGENLKFLSSQAKFYTGEGFLLAARKEGDRLFGLELLGEVSKAGGILSSLGCTEGKFRVIGNERDFAMFIPLKENVIVPTYFAFAFD